MNIRTIIAIGFIALAPANALAATQTDAAPAFDHAGLAHDVIDHYIRPRTSAFADTASALQTDTTAYCHAPTRKNYKRAAKAFESAALDYARFEFLRFGPDREDNRQERLLLYPDPKGLVRKQVTKTLAEADRSILAPGALAKKSVALQGFPALEIALFEDNPERELSKKGSFRCAYAQAITENIANIAVAIRDEWRSDTGFVKLMLEPGPDNPAYMNSQEVTLEIIGAFLHGLEQLRDNRIAGPLGLRELGKAETEAALERASISTAFIAADIDGLLALYEQGGLKSRIGASDQSMADVISTELKNARDLAQSVKLPFATARKQDAARAKLVALGFPLKNALSIAGGLSSEATGLSVGFNAGDGD